jgi:hypothetical protein
MPQITLAPNLAIDLEVVIGKRFTAVGKSGEGKTASLFVFAEQWLDNNLPIIVIDSMSQFRDLKRGYPVIVAGMEMGDDLSVSRENAARVAKHVFDNRLSLVLDTGMMKPGQDIEMLTEFLSKFWELVLAQGRENAQPWALVVDEAQQFIPQRGQTAISATLRDMSKRGRHRNLSIFAATQRPSSIEKDFLEMSNMVIWHRVIGRDAEVLGDSMSLSKAQINKKLQSFMPGDAIVLGDRALIGEKDYLNIHVNESRTANLEIGYQPVDEDVITRLRNISGVAEEMEKIKPISARSIMTLSDPTPATVVEEQPTLDELAAVSAIVTPDDLWRAWIMGLPAAQRNVVSEFMSRREKRGTWMGTRRQFVEVAAKKNAVPARREDVYYIGQFQVTPSEHAYLSFIQSQ